MLPPAGPGQHVDPMYAHNQGPSQGSMQQNMVPVGPNSLPSVPMGGGSTGKLPELYFGCTKNDIWMGNQPQHQY